MIEVSNITKTFKISKRNPGFRNAMKSFINRQYEEVHAVKNISFSIKEGEMVGYIGPNGAGKSTTIKMLSGILTPTSGTCIANGKTPWKERKSYTNDIGVVFGQKTQLWWDIPVEESFLLLKEIYGVSDKNYKNKLEQLQEMLDLEGILKTQTRQLSLGQRMRAELSASLIHSPKLLFLDEPTIGLDSVAKLAVRDFIKKINAEEKTTVILTTHDTQDLEALTDRIILIGKGEKLLDGSLSDLKNKHKGRNLDEIVVELYKEHKI